MLSVKISEVSDGIEFEVIAKPRAKKDGFAGVHDGALRISVTAPPEKGKANAAILRVLADLLDVPVSSVAVIAGETSRRKRVRVAGVRKEQLLKVIGEEK